MPDLEFYQQLANVIDDLVANLLYYDRKESENLPAGVIESHIRQGDITEDTIIFLFDAALRLALADGKT